MIYFCDGYRMVAVNQSLAFVSVRYNFAEIEQPDETWRCKHI